jgi:outer membrane protein assembly factor BamD
LLNRLLEKHLNSLFILFVFTTLSTLIVGCGSEEATKQLSAGERYELGMKAFRNEDYLAAIEEFKVVSLQYQGSNVADSAQFYMGECRYLRGEYILAAFEYDILLRTMPSSVFAPRARFRRATCYYELSPSSILDQNYSRKAIDEYQAFLEYYPADTLVSLAEQRINELNTKLAQKDFQNGMTYMHMEYYKAATYYFDIVLDKYHDTQYAEPSLLRKAEALANRKKYADAKEALEKFREKYPSSSLKADADNLYSIVDAGLRDEKTKKQKAQEPMKDTSKQVPQLGQ